MEACPGCLCWQPQGEDWPEERGHITESEDTKIQPPPESGTLPQSSTPADSTHSEAELSTVQTWKTPQTGWGHSRKQRLVHSRTYTVTFHTAEDAMLQHEAWINQTNEDADSAPSSSSFKLTLCLPHSLILCPSALLARSVSAREEPDGLLKVMWGKCGISPTGSISNLFTSSEPQLDGRHATKLNNEITSSQTNEEINERWMEQTERQENKNNK